MDQRDLPLLRSPAGVHRASAGFKFGERAGMAAEVTITSTGLLAIGALVSSILLASAVIVYAARQPLSD